MYINMLSDYLKEKYGEKYYRLSLNGGMTCPNRDGTCGTKGCLFCTETGSGEFTPDAYLSIDEQIKKAKELVANKNTSDKYIAYFQAFSNTYAPIEYLRKLYFEVIGREDIAILSIATRPDCINAEVLEMLQELNSIKPVWIELGLQTSDEDTAKLIRRGYTNDVYEKAAKEIRSIGCQVITHIILGLPNESKEDMVKSAEYAGKHSDGLKFHMLYVAENTEIESMYLNKEFVLLEREEYIDTLCECLRVVPPYVVIHRITGDGDKKTLVAPLWTANKKRVLKEIENAFVDRDIKQGEKYKSPV